MSRVGPMAVSSRHRSFCEEHHYTSLMTEDGQRRDGPDDQGGPDGGQLLTPQLL